MRIQLLLAVVTTAAVGVFIGKAFSIDDPLFVWMAEQITRHPLDPYGFNVNWVGAPEPMWSAMQNPPLCSYFIAGIGSLFGWNEVALHSAFLLWPVAAAIGTYRIARRFCATPALATLLTVFTPVFLVSAGNVMCDVMLLAFYVWTIELWLIGLNRNRCYWLVLAALFGSAALLTKYFGLSVVGLLAAYTLRARWRDWPRLGWLAIPCLVTALYDLWSTRVYGHALFAGATHYAKVIAAEYAVPLPKQLLIGFAFTGGCVFAPILFGVRCGWRIWLAVGVTFTSWLICFFIVVPQELNISAFYHLAGAEEALFATVGCAMIALALHDFWKSRSAESLLLLLWIIGTWAFVTFLNWSVTARTILPLTPAAAILLLRQFPTSAVANRFGVITLSAAVSFWVAAADYRMANIARAAAGEFRERFEHWPGTVWFQSHWGFQFYMQRWGARLLNVRNSEVRSGDLIIVPANNTAVAVLPLEWINPPEQRFFRTVPVVTTLGIRTGACFYSSLRGPLPWAAGPLLQESYYVATFR